MNAALEISHLTKRYGKEVAVDDISFSIQKGEFFGFLGKNGAGKTSTIHSITGIARFQEGTIKIDGFDVVKEVRRQNVNPTFIFVTRYDQYAIKAIHNAVFDYLLKPVDIDELKEAIERFCCLREEKRQINLPKNLKNKYSLTQREIEIIELIAQYKSSKEIANILFISRHTVDTHRRHILRKTEMKTTAEFLSHLYNF